MCGTYCWSNPCPGSQTSSQFRMWDVQQHCCHPFEIHHIPDPFSWQYANLKLTGFALFFQANLKNGFVWGRLIISWKAIILPGKENRHFLFQSVELTKSNLHRQLSSINVLAKDLSEMQALCMVSTGNKNSNSGASEEEGRRAMELCQ